MAKGRLDIEEVPVVVEQVMREDGFQPNACIAAARITTIALTRLGVPGARAVACQFDAVTPATLEMLESASARGIGPHEFSDTEKDEWSRRGAVWVSLVDESPGRGYSGHVVTLLGDDWLIDPTLTQASRPERGMPLGPIAIRLEGDPSDAVSVQLRSGATILYQLDPARTDFRAAPDWREVPRMSGTINRVVQRLRGGARI